MAWCGGSVRPRTSTARPGRTDHASSAVCRLTCSNGASSLVTTDSAAPHAPKEAAAEGSDLAPFLAVGGVKPVEEGTELGGELACIRLGRVVRHTARLTT